MKYLITEDFDGNFAKIQTALGLPSVDATTYCTPQTVTNENNADFGKFIIPIKESGTWKCDQLYDASELEDFDPDWYPPGP